MDYTQVRRGQVCRPQPSLVYRRLCNSAMTDEIFTCSIWHVTEPDQNFAPGPPDVWNFHSGGYQVIGKYLNLKAASAIVWKYLDARGSFDDSFTKTGRKPRALGFRLDQCRRCVRMD
jgi:hypothetical protein